MVHLNHQAVVLNESLSGALIAQDGALMRLRGAVRLYDEQ